MLVLTRKQGEAVCIGNDVELFVVGISRGKVKLGFRAPRHVAILRAEAPSRGPRDETAAAVDAPPVLAGEWVAAAATAEVLEPAI